MFCKKCGATLKDGETFCASCGEYVSKNSNTYTAPPSKPSTHSTQSSASFKNPALGAIHAEPHSMGWITLLRVCAWVTFGIIVIAGMILFNDSDLAFLYMLLSVVVGLLMIAGIMVNLDKAEDIRSIRSTLELIYNKNNRLKQGNEESLKSFEDEIKHVNRSLDFLVNAESKKQ